MEFIGNKILGMANLGPKINRVKIVLRNQREAL